MKTSYQIIILLSEFYDNIRKGESYKEKSNYLFHRKKQKSNSEGGLEMFLDFL